MTPRQTGRRRSSSCAVSGTRTDFKPDEEYENEFGKTLDDFAKFNGAEEIDWRLEKTPTSA